MTFGEKKIPSIIDVEPYVRRLVVTGKDRGTQIDSINQQHHHLHKLYYTIFLIDRKQSLFIFSFLYLTIHLLSTPFHHQLSASNQFSKMCFSLHVIFYIHYFQNDFLKKKRKNTFHMYKPSKMYLDCAMPKSEENIWMEQVEQKSEKRAKVLRLCLTTANKENKQNKKNGDKERKGECRQNGLVHSYITTPQSGLYTCMANVLCTQM